MSGSFCFCDLAENRRYSSLSSQALRRRRVAQCIRGGGYLYEKANPESGSADLAYSVSTHFPIYSGRKKNLQKHKKLPAPVWVLV